MTDISLFDYVLPDDLIARHPAAERTASRLLVVEQGIGRFRELPFARVPELLSPGDLLVLNETRVLPARLAATRAGSGGRVEVLLERILDGERIIAQTRSTKPLRAGAELELPGGCRATVAGVADGLRELRLTGAGELVAYFEKYGAVPLPPYLGRSPCASDRERYQTVYAREPGAVAAPTAGLHFDRPLLERIEAAGVAIGRLTLHVGAGTFQPLRVAAIEDHRMHRERFLVPGSLCERFAAVRAAGGRVIAVGTTVVRALESACDDGVLRAGAGDTDLYIHPGYRFRAVDALLTNFHLPRSSLLILVSAFAGLDRVRAAYRHAVDARFRFFSYGDAMFVERAAP